MQLPQKPASLRRGRQHPHIGHFARRFLQPQKRRPQHPPHPRGGVASGGGQSQNFCRRAARLHRPIHPSVKPLAAAVVGSKVVFVQQPQPRQHSPLQPVGANRGAPAFHLPPQNLRRRSGHQGESICRLSRRQKRPDLRGRGIAEVPPVLPPHRARLHGEPPAQNGLEILRSQRVVGLGEKRGAASHALLQHRLPRRRVGQPALHLLPDGLRQRLLQQRLRHGLQRADVPAFAAEIELCHAAFCQQYHAAVCEFFRRGHGPGRGQLRHQIGAASHGHFRSGKFAQAGRAAPLGVVSAHGAHHRQPRFRLRRPQQHLMPLVQGVKFAHNARRFHGRTSFFILHCNLFSRRRQRPVAICYKKRYNMR